MKKLACRWLLHTLCLGTTLLLTVAIAHAQSPIVLQGTVTDRSTGVPLAGITVNLFGCGETVTDANGNYSLSAEQVCDNASGSLYVSGSGYYVALSSYTITASPTTFDMTLLAGGTVLQGTLTEASTQVGIAGAMVFVCTEASPYECADGMTDPAGQYTIDSSRFYESAASGFTVSQIRVFAAGNFNYQSQSPLEISPPLPVTQNIAMASDAGIVLQGTVTDRSTGVPLAGITVNLFGCGETVTDANGNYSLSAEQVCDNASGSLYVSGSGYYVALSSYTITASPTTFDMTLLAGGTVLQGTVTEASTQVGIAGAMVLVCTDASPYECADGMTDPAGQYTIDSSRFYESAASGFTVLQIHAFAAGNFNYQSQSPLEISPPLPVTQNIAMASDAGIVLQGTVTDRSTGVPLAGITVNLFGCGETVTDANGNYSLNAEQVCDNTSGSLYVSGSGYYVALSSYTITASPTTFDMTLLAGGTVLQGTVTEASTQVGIAGATVLVCTEASPYECADGMTDTAGQYTIDSSRFYESAASGFAVSQIRVFAAGDFNDQSQSQLNVSPPLRVTQNIQVSSTGISQALQTINVPSLPNRTYGDSPFTVTATASPGLPVTFSAVGNCSVSVSGTVSCTVTASSDGNAHYLAAPDVARTFSIAEASTTTSLASSLKPSNVGQAVTLGAAVSSTVGTPTDSVTFMDGATALGTQPFVAGQALLTTPALPTGVHGRTAASGGDLNYTVEMAFTEPPTNATRGSSFTVTDTVINQGGWPAPAATTRYYLSLDMVRNTGDKLLTGTRSVPTLNPGESSTGTVTVTIPNSTTLATYFLLVCPDDVAPKVMESSETNNCRASAGTIAVGP